MNWLKKIFAVAAAVAAVVFAPVAIAALAATSAIGGSVIVAGALYGAAAGAVVGGLWTGTTQGALKGALVGGLIGGAAGLAGVGAAPTTTSAGGVFGTGVGTGAPGTTMGGWGAAPSVATPTAAVAAPPAVLALDPVTGIQTLASEGGVLAKAGAAPLAANEMTTAQAVLLASKETAAATAAASANTANAMKYAAAFQVGGNILTGLGAASAKKEEVDMTKEAIAAAKVISDRDTANRNYQPLYPGYTGPTADRPRQPRGLMETRVA